MRLAEALLIPSGVIALVGAGGKTAALFGLGEELALQGRDVLMTTTTHIFDPRRETGRLFDQVVLDGACPWERVPPRPDRGRRIVLAACDVPELGKLKGVAPERIGELERLDAFIVVEADGAKRHPVKAPASHEPVVPAAAGLVLGVIGLDCLGQPLNDATVHRPDRFGAITGCAPQAPIQLEHLAALVRSPQGLFKDTPAGASRALLLNKADRCSLAPADLLDQLKACGDLPVDRILVCALRHPDPERRVLAWMACPPRPAACASGGLPTCP